jgi:hypothetical protein
MFHAYIPSRILWCPFTCTLPGLGYLLYAILSQPNDCHESLRLACKRFHDISHLLSPIFTLYFSTFRASIIYDDGAYCRFISKALREPMYKDTARRLWPGSLQVPYLRSSFLLTCLQKGAIRQSVCSTNRSHRIQLRLSRRCGFL